MPFVRDGSAQESNLDLEVRILPGPLPTERQLTSEPGGRTRSKCLRGLMLPLHQFARIHPGVEPGPPSQMAHATDTPANRGRCTVRPRVYKATQLTTEAASHGRRWKVPPPCRVEAHIIVILKCTIPSMASSCRSSSGSRWWAELSPNLLCGGQRSFSVLGGGQQRASRTPSSFVRSRCARAHRRACHAGGGRGRVAFDGGRKA